MATSDKNLVVGKGKIYFERFGAGQTVGRGAERYLGSTTGFSIAISTENLDHFSSEGGVRQKDASLALSTTRTGTLGVENVSPENLALFVLGTSSTVTTAASTVTDESHANVEQGLYYQLGTSTTHPSGVRGLVPHTAPANIIVKVASDTKVEGDDYEIDMETGRLYIVPGGDIADAATILVSYKIGVFSRDLIVSGDDAIEGALRFVADNAAGTNRDAYLPSVKLTPNGDYAFKSDEWAAMSFNIEVIKPVAAEAIYVEGRPYVAA